MHQCLTNELWEMIQGCWDRDPQRRPDISEVVLCLQATSALRHDGSHLNGCQELDDTTIVESVREKQLTTGEFPFIAFEKVVPRVIERVAFPIIPLGVPHPPVAS